MAKQKQGGGKALQGTNGTTSQKAKPGSRNAQKQHPSYSKGPKGGGPTLAEQVAAHERRVAQELQEAQRPRRFSYW